MVTVSRNNVCLIDCVFLCILSAAFGILWLDLDLGVRVNYISKLLTFLHHIFLAFFKFIYIYIYIYLVCFISWFHPTKNTRLNCLSFYMYTRSLRKAIRYETFRSLFTCFIYMYNYIHTLNHCSMNQHSSHPACFIFTSPSNNIISINHISILHQVSRYIEHRQSSYTPSIHAFVLFHVCTVH